MQYSLLCGLVHFRPHNHTKLPVSQLVFENAPAAAAEFLKERSDIFSHGRSSAAVLACAAASAAGSIPIWPSVLVPAADRICINSSTGATAEGASELGWELPGAPSLAWPVPSALPFPLPLPFLLAAGLQSLSFLPPPAI